MTEPTDRKSAAEMGAREIIDEVIDELREGLRSGIRTHNGTPADWATAAGQIATLVDLRLRVPQLQS